MNTKEKDTPADNLLLVLISYNNNSMKLVRELIKNGGFKIRLLTDDMINTKKSLFDIWEKIEGVYEYSATDIKDDLTNAMNRKGVKVSNVLCANEIKDSYVLNDYIKKGMYLKNLQIVKIFEDQKVDVFTYVNIIDITGADINQILLEFLNKKTIIEYSVFHSEKPYRVIRQYYLGNEDRQNIDNLINKIIDEEKDTIQNKITSLNQRLQNQQQYKNIELFDYKIYQQYYNNANLFKRILYKEGYFDNRRGFFTGLFLAGLGFKTSSFLLRRIFK